MRDTDRKVEIKKIKADPPKREIKIVGAKDFRQQQPEIKKQVKP